jgi:hypothetical protein
MILDRIAKTCEDFARRDHRVNVTRSSSVNTSGVIGRPVRAIDPPYTDLSGEFPAQHTSTPAHELIDAIRAIDATNADVAAIAETLRPCGIWADQSSSAPADGGDDA